MRTLAKEFGFGTRNVRTMLRLGSLKEYHTYSTTTYMLWPYRRPDGKGKQ
jgi:hypothetical protein